MKLNEVTACRLLLVNTVKPWLLQLSKFLFRWKSEFIISSCMRGLSQMQIRMPHISTCISMFLHVSVCQWHRVAFCVSRQHRLCRWRPGRIFMLYSWKADVFIHCLWNNVYNRWFTSNFPWVWHRTTSTANGCKSSPRKIFHRNSSGECQLKFSGERIEEHNC